MAQTSFETQSQNMSCQHKMNRFKEEKLRKPHNFSNIFSGNWSILGRQLRLTESKSVYTKRKYNEFHYNTLHSFAERSYFHSCFVLPRLYFIVSICSAMEWNKDIFSEQKRAQSKILTVRRRLRCFIMSLMECNTTLNLFRFKLLNEQRVMK